MGINAYKDIREFHKVVGRFTTKKLQLEYPGVRFSHAMNIIAIGKEEKRLTDISISAEISQQASGKTIKELHGMGYIEMQTDEKDRRATLIKLSPLGLMLLASVESINQELVSEIDIGYIRGMATFIKNQMILL